MAYFFGPCTLYVVWKRYTAVISLPTNADQNISIFVTYNCCYNAPCVPTVLQSTQCAKKCPLRFFGCFLNNRLEFQSEILPTYLVILSTHNGVLINSKRLLRNCTKSYGVCFVAPYSISHIRQSNRDVSPCPWTNFKSLHVQSL